MYELLYIFFFKFQSECRILLKKHSNENIVLQAVMDEFEENREKGNLTAELLNREKVTIDLIFFKVHICMYITYF